MEEKSVVQYVARDGQSVKLSPAIIKGFLVSGYPDLVTNQELYMYMGVCKSRGLNPFIKDCYLIKYGKKDAAAVIVSIDYYRKRARAQEDCVGWKTGIVVKNLDGKMEYREGCIKLDGETLLGGWFEATPRGFDIPMKKIVPLERYIKRTNEGKITRFWSEMNQPEQISKVAESQGLRATWPDEFQGLYTDAERESMDAQAGFQQGVVTAAQDEQRRNELEAKLGSGKPAVEEHKEQPPQTMEKDPAPAGSAPPPRKEAAKSPQSGVVEPVANGGAAAYIHPKGDPVRDTDIYKDFDPFTEAVAQRYHAAKVLKITDELVKLDVPFAGSWPGAKLHQLLIDKSFTEPLPPEPPPKPWIEPEPEPEELPDDPQLLLGLQSDIARAKAAEPELYRHAYINQLQMQTVRPDVKTSEMTIAECEALLEDVAGQVNLRDQLG